MYLNIKKKSLLTSNFLVHMLFILLLVFQLRTALGWLLRFIPNAGSINWTHWSFTATAHLYYSVITNTFISILFILTLVGLFMGKRWAWILGVLGSIVVILMELIFQLFLQANSLQNTFALSYFVPFALINAALLLLSLLGLRLSAKKE